MAHWLVTWEATTPALLPDRKVALVLPARRSGKEVQRIVEALYISHSYTEAEALSAVKTNPYPAAFGNFADQITCGHNPHLYARVVEKLKLNSAGHLEWQERPRLIPTHDTQ